MDNSQIQIFNFQFNLTNLYVNIMPIIKMLSFCIFSMLILQTISYTVTFDCLNKCSGCAASCFVFDGGPFDSNKICVASCAGIYKTETTIGCSFSCSGNCDYSYTTRGYTITGCATPQDNLWTAIELQFNQAYKVIKGGNNYDWSGGVCTWTIIGIVVGILGGIALVIVAIIFIKKRRATRGRSLLNSSIDQ